MSQMMTETKTITPEWAQEQIDELTRRVAMDTFHQRPIREGAIKRYAMDMKKGKWLVTHQGIAFDDAGNLIDGQNRLRAVIQAGVPVKMRVTVNVPAEQEGAGELSAMDTIDLGVPRNMAQAFQVSHGYAGEAIELAVIARNIARLVISNPNRQGMRSPQQGMSVDQGLFILEKLGYGASAERLSVTVPRKAWRPGSLAAPWCWYHQVHPRKAELFASNYNSLENLGKGHPALLLNRYITTQSLRPRRRELGLMALVANTLYSFHHDISLGVLRPNDEAHLWLLKLNWPNVEKITDRMIGEKAAEEPQEAPRKAA